MSQENVNKFLNEFPFKLSSKAIRDFIELKTPSDSRLRKGAISVIDPDKRGYHRLTHRTSRLPSLFCKKNGTRSRIFRKIFKKELVTKERFAPQP
jgi:hypothetical protein